MYLSEIVHRAKAGKRFCPNYSEPQKCPSVTFNQHHQRVDILQPELMAGRQTGLSAESLKTFGGMFFTVNATFSGVSQGSKFDRLFMTDKLLQTLKP